MSEILVDEGDYLIMKYGYEGKVSDVYQVVDVDEDKKGKPVYTITLCDVETEDIDEPGTSIGYGMGMGMSAPSVYLNRRFKGIKGLSNRTKEVQFSSFGGTVYEKNPQTGRFREMKRGKLYPCTEKALEKLNIEFYEINDREKVNSLFAKHPEWTKEPVRKYDMSVRESKINTLREAKQELREHGYILEKKKFTPEEEKAMLAKIDRERREDAFAKCKATLDAMVDYEPNIRKANKYFTSLGGTCRVDLSNIEKETLKDITDKFKKEWDGPNQWRLRGKYFGNGSAYGIGVPVGTYCEFLAENPEYADTVVNLYARDGHHRVDLNKIVYVFERDFGYLTIEVTGLKQDNIHFNFTIGSNNSETLTRIADYDPLFAKHADWPGKYTEDEILEVIEKFQDLEVSEEENARMVKDKEEQYRINKEISDYYANAKPGQYFGD